MDLLPWQCPSQSEEDNRLKLPFANKNREKHVHTNSQHPSQTSVAKCRAFFLPQIQAESKTELYQQPQPCDTAKHSLPDDPALFEGCLSITLSTFEQIFTSQKFKTEHTHTHKKEECPHLSNVFHSKVYETTQTTQNLKPNSHIPLPWP